MSDYMKVLLAVVCATFFVFILPSCTIHQDEGGLDKVNDLNEEVVTKKNPTAGLNPRRDMEYWEVAYEGSVKHNGSIFTCSHGVPVLYLPKGGEFEIIPENVTKAWRFCLAHAIRTAEAEND